MKDGGGEEQCGRTDAEEKGEIEVAMSEERIETLKKKKRKRGGYGEK